MTAMTAIHPFVYVSLVLLVLVGVAVVCLMLRLRRRRKLRLARAVTLTVADVRRVDPNPVTLPSVGPAPELVRPYVGSPTMTQTRIDMRPDGETKALPVLGSGGPVLPVRPAWARPGVGFAPTLPAAESVQLPAGVDPQPWWTLPASPDVPTLLAPEPWQLAAADPDEPAPLYKALRLDRPDLSVTGPVLDPADRALLERMLRDGEPLRAGAPSPNGAAS